MRYSIKNATEQQVKQSGGQNLRVLKSMKVVYADLTPEQAKILERAGCKVQPIADVSSFSGLESISVGQIAPPPIPTITPAGPTLTPAEVVEATGFNEFWTMCNPPLVGKWFNVALIDTGIRKTHEALGDVVYEKDYTTDGNTDDGFNHGTGVASIIHAVAPMAGILNLKVIDSLGNGTDELVAAALDDIITMYDNQDPLTPCIINMSVGGPDDLDPENIMREACREAAARGIWLFAAAGNYGPVGTTITMPANEGCVCAVGSINYDPFIVADYSSRGPTPEGLIKPDVCMFGSNMKLASSAGDDSYATKSGTSFSCPYVAGLGCLVFEGIVRGAEAQGFLSNLLTGSMILPKMDYVIGSMMPQICIKPDDVDLDKDNFYGYGLAFGPLAKAQFAAQASNMVDAMKAAMPAFLMSAFAMALPVKIG